MRGYKRQGWLRLFAGAALGLIVPLCGCTAMEKITVNGVERLYSVHLPEKIRFPAKLVFFFHGAGGSHRDAETFYAEASRRNYIVVGLQGLMNAERYYLSLAGFPVAIAGWSLSSETDGPEHPDLQYFDAVLSRITADYEIDRSHIHLAGMSNGGFFINMFAGYRHEVIASVAAANAGMRLGEQGGSCGAGQTGFCFIDPLDRLGNWYPDLERKYPVYLIAGQEDTLVAPGVVESARDRYLEAGFPTVVYRSVAGLGHSWASPDNNAEGFDSSSSILDFFDLHPQPGDA